VSRVVDVATCDLANGRVLIVTTEDQRRRRAHGHYREQEQVRPIWLPALPFHTTDSPKATA
jgi:hypothetical protein